MQGFIKLKDGWIESISICEMGINYDELVAEGNIPVGDSDVIRKLILCQPIMFYDGTQFCQVKNPPDIWKRVKINGLPTEEYQKLINNLDASFPDIPIGAVIGEPVAIKKQFTPDFETELKPGLKVSLSGIDDVDIWERAMVDSGLYTPEEAFIFSRHWLSDSLTWPVKVTWKDRPLQIELHQLGMGNILIGGFTAHLDRTRPRWFWKQTALPVLKALYAHGFETINEQVRGDKPHYAQFLSETYGHEILRSTDKFINLHLNIKEAIQRIDPWPARRTMGPDWKWEKDVVLVREATEADFPAIYKAIDESWGDEPRKQLVISLFEDRWALDAAAILLTIVDGKILEARMFRERKEKTLSLRTVLLKTIIDEKTDLSFVGMLEWEKAVGYTDTSYILESKLYEDVKDKWRKDDWTIFSQNEDITEMRLKIEEVLAKKQTPK